MSHGNVRLTRLAGRENANGQAIVDSPRETAIIASKQGPLLVPA
jgi:hypothetical protein